MFVILGPAACQSTNYGSKTTPHSIASRMRPLNAKDHNGWVAGHLLNDNMGGSGTSSVNLTPLTRKTNRAHATYEGWIKTFCDRIFSFHSNRDNRNVNYWYGVRYVVTVSLHAFGPSPPHTKAPAEITIESRVVKVPKATVSDYSENGVPDDVDVNEFLYDGFIVKATDRFASDKVNFPPLKIKNVL